MQTKTAKERDPERLCRHTPGLKIFIQWRRAVDPQSIDKGSHFSADSKITTLLSPSHQSTSQYESFLPLILP